MLRIRDNGRYNSLFLTFVIDKQGFTVFSRSGLTAVGEETVIQVVPFSLIGGCALTTKRPIV